jgi:uncharacterized GH25 family protein
MKKSILLAALFLLVSVATFAGDNELGETSKFKVVAKSAVKYDLYYVSESDDPVTISIYDIKGNLISTDRVKNHRSFKRTYNFKELASGSYKIVVNNTEGKASQTVFHNPQQTNLQLILSQIPATKSFKLHVGAFDTTKPVKVKVYDGNNKLLFVDEINQSESFSKIYNLREIDADIIRFTVANNKESISQFRSLN